MVAARVASVARPRGIIVWSWASVPGFVPAGRVAIGLGLRPWRDNDLRRDRELPVGLRVGFTSDKGDAHATGNRS